MLCLKGSQNELPSREIALTAPRNRGRKTRLSPSTAPPPYGGVRPTAAAMSGLRTTQANIPTRCPRPQS